MSVCINRCCSYIPQRIVVAVLCASAMMIVALKRACVEKTLLTVTIRVPPSTLKMDWQDNDGCPFSDIDDEPQTEIQIVRDFGWTRTKTQVIYYSFFIASAMGQIPAGLLADWRGARVVFGTGVLISSLVCILQPFLIYENYYLFMAGTIVQGFTQCVLLPCTITIMARWAPVNERSTLIGTILSCYYIGGAISHAMFYYVLTERAGQLANHYIVGAVGLVWCFLWFVFAYNSPTANPYISELELSFFSPTTDSKRSLDVPWRKILKSPPFLVLLLINCAEEWKFKLVAYEVLIPYLENTLHVYSEKNELIRLVEAAPFPTAVVGGILSDWLVNNEIISRTTCRKIFGFAGVVIPIFLTVFIPEIGCNPVYYLTLLVVTFLFSGFIYGSIMVNPIDLSPRYAGLIMAMANTAALFTSLFPGNLVVAIVKDKPNVRQWRVIFWGSMVIVTILSVPYLLYGSGDKQPWALSRRSARFSSAVTQDTDQTQNQTRNENQDWKDIRCLMT